MDQPLTLARLLSQVVQVLGAMEKATDVWCMNSPRRENKSYQALTDLRVTLNSLKVLALANSQLSFVVLAKLLLPLRPPCAYAGCWKNRRGRARSAYTADDLLREKEAFDRAYTPLYSCRHRLAEDALGLAIALTQ
jgi:hypothetical protein